MSNPPEIGQSSGCCLSSDFDCGSLFESGLDEGLKSNLRKIKSDPHLKNLIILPSCTSSH
jgi:hypothetical protein